MPTKFHHIFYLNICQISLHKERHRQYFSLKMFLVREIVLTNNIPAIFTMFRMFLFLVLANVPKENTKKNKTQFQHAWYKFFVFQSMLFHKL